MYSVYSVRLTVYFLYCSLDNRLTRKLHLLDITFCRNYTWISSHLMKKMNADGFDIPFNYESVIVSLSFQL